MRLYIAGPMSGYPAFNIPAFDDAAETLRKRGHEVFSPAEIDGPVSREVLLESKDGDHSDLPPGESWSYYLSRDFRIIADEHIDAIVALPGWEKSKGAGLEIALARQLGVSVIPFDEFDAAVAQMYDADLYDEHGTFIPHDANPERQRAVTGAVKDNRSKPRIDLIPSAPLMGAGDVLAYGARKYKPNNWRLGLGWSDTYASLQRHLLAFNEGEDIDPESGLPHVDHAMCQLLFLSNYYHTKTGDDDRWASVDHEEAKA